MEFYYTPNTDGEIERFIRISFESIDDFDEKENRNKKPNLSKEAEELLETLCNYINEERGNPRELYNLLKEVMRLTQLKNLKELENMI